MVGAANGRGLPRFEILGPLRAWHGEWEIDLGPAKQRAVLTALLVNANRPITTAQIVDAVWGNEPPENGANVVQKYVAGLRRVLEPDRSPRSPGLVVTLNEAGYQVSIDAERLDAELFHRCVRQAHDARNAGKLPEATALIQQALALWRGSPLAGLAGPLFDAARERLVEARATALEAWADLEIQRGNHAQVLARLIELVAEYPLREELRYLLILALYRAGRQAEALAAFRDARQLLIDEVGVEPGERLQQLHRSILRADPALGPPAVAPPLLIRPPALAPAPARRSRAWPWVIRIMAGLFPLVTCGFGSWAIIGYYAGRKRSWRLALAAAGFLGLVILFVTGMEMDPEAAGAWSGFGVLALILSTVGGAVHAVYLSAKVPTLARPDPAALAAAVEQARREQARQIARHHPSIARELRIGRPDLPRYFDDGGLVDVNSAPEVVLVSLPGVGPELARRIATDRYLRGALTSVDELVHRGLVPPELAGALSDVLIAVPAVELQVG